VLVAVLGTATRNAADFHSAWLITIAGGLSAGLALAALGPPVRGLSEKPIIAGPIADPLLAEPLVAERAA
jgi:hypothetical protein